MREDLSRPWMRLAVAVAAVWLVLAGCTGATSATPDEQEPEKPDPEEVAAAAALSEQVEGGLVTSIQALSMPSATAQAEAIGTVADFTALVDPTAGPPSTEECAPPMLSEGADGDGDGYPAVRTTLRIDCSFDFPMFVFRLAGSLVLLDENDLNPESGFESELDYRLTVTTEGKTLTADGVRIVGAMQDGSGYDLTYEGRDRVIDSYLVFQIRLAYRGTLAGTFKAGTLAIGGGTLTFTSTPVNCAVLADAKREACEEQVQENPGSSGTLTVKTTGLNYDDRDTAGCETLFTGGHVDMEDGAGNVLRISYAGCGERTVTYNGWPVPPRPPETG